MKSIPWANPFDALTAASGLRVSIGGPQFWTAIPARHTVPALTGGHPVARRLYPTVTA
jgi:hypothetical protein